MSGLKLSMRDAFGRLEPDAACCDVCGRPIDVDLDPAAVAFRTAYKSTEFACESCRDALLEQEQQVDAL